MKNNGRSIFRPAALRHYGGGATKNAPPPFTPQRTFALLWILVGLLISAVAAGLLAEVPVYTEAPGVVLARGEGAAGSPDGALLLLLLMPASEARRVAAGQRVLISAEQDSDTAEGFVISVEDDAVSPSRVSERFDLSRVQAARAGGPVAVTLVSFKPAGLHAHPDAFEGAHLNARVRVGSRRLVSFFRPRAREDAAERAGR